MPPAKTVHAKQMASNMLFLYIRQIAITILRFFTTRELLIVLGVSDFGLVNIIGGVVSMFSFLSGMLSSSTSRFFNFNIGKGDLKELKSTFNTAFQMYAVLIVLSFLLLETFGSFAVENWIIVPDERKEAAFTFYQTMVLSFIFNIATLPYTALVIAHENMKVFSIVSMVDCLGKLLIVYIVSTSPFDKLAFYGGCFATVSLLSLLVYFIFCAYKYPETHLHFKFKKRIFKDMFFFSAWNTWGATAPLFATLLVNMLLNNYFGAAINSARAIATQVSSGIMTFFDSFLTAVKPQIIKQWAAGSHNNSYSIVLKSTKFGFILILLFAIPILFNVDFILNIWLENIPNYTNAFISIAIIQTLISVLSHPMISMIQATGKVAIYQIVCGILYWTALPLSFVFLKLGYSPISAAIIILVIEVVALPIRLYFLRHLTGISLKEFIFRVLFPCSSLFTITTSTATLIYIINGTGWIRFISITIASILIISVSTYFLFTEKEEKKFIFNILKNKIKFINDKSI